MTYGKEEAEFPLFNEHADCPMCSYRVILSTYYGPPDGTDDEPQIRLDYKGKPVLEKKAGKRLRDKPFVCRECKRCGYFWGEEPLNRRAK